MKAKTRLLALTCIAAMSCNVHPTAEERAAKLIGGLTLEEKASLMVHPSAPVTVTAADADSDGDFVLKAGKKKIVRRV